MSSLLKPSGAFQILSHLRRAQERLTTEIQTQLEPLDLTLDLMDLIYAIDRIGGGTPEEIEGEWGRGGDALATGIRALQLRGILTRPRPKEDPATTRLRFTTEGRDRVKRAHAALEKTLDRAAGWLGAQREPLLKSLDRLAIMPPA